MMTRRRRIAPSSSIGVIHSQNPTVRQLVACWQAV
jgi:hypothetical protein